MLAKAPGGDGLLPELYKELPKVLADILLMVYREALETGVLPASMREAMVALLPKQGKDPLDAASYRPLSMLNIDQKILGQIQPDICGDTSHNLYTQSGRDSYPVETLYSIYGIWHM